MSSRIIGIDLGTTNSLVAYVDEATGLPRVIPDADGRPLLPSVVAFTPDGIVVGEPARRQLARRPADTVYSVKRLMSRGFEDVKDEARYLPFRILAGEGLVRLAVGGREVTSPEVSAVVLKALKERAERDRDCVDLARDPEAIQELRLAAEAAKIRLSSEERTTLTLPFAGFTYRREMKRADLERLVEPLVGRTLGPCRRALADAGLSAADIDEVVLVGGSTRVPLVRRRVQELFGKTPHRQLNPDEVVALGAAVQAHILAGGITNMLLLDVTPLSLGIESLGGIVNVLIPRNTTIPTSAREMFTTSVDGQHVVDMHVVQGEREVAKDC